MEPAQCVYMHLNKCHYSLSQKKMQPYLMFDQFQQAILAAAAGSMAQAVPKGVAAIQKLWHR